MQMMKKRTNCYIYIRVSTSMQVDGYSLDAQREKLRGYAAYQEMTVVGEYSDEGFSGKNIQGRMEFRRMLEDIQAQKDSVDFAREHSAPTVSPLYIAQVKRKYGILSRECYNKAKSGEALRLYGMIA